MSIVRLYNHDCVEYLKMTDRYYDAIFLDPPDNIGLNYNGFNDNMPGYFRFIRDLLFWSCFRSKVVWCSFNSKWWNLFVSSASGLSYDRKIIIWTFTFGQYNDRDFGSSYRPILRLSNPNWRLNTDYIRISSKRQLLGDPRAMGPRVPGDVWEFPRVTGNSKERRSWHPTQHPEGLVERIFKASFPLLENLKAINERREPRIPRFFDGFAGSGTSIRVCKRNNWDLDTCEISQYYCEKLKGEHDDIEAYLV